MVLTVRGVSDWFRANHFWLLAMLLLGSAQAARSQEKYDTPQQTNDKIQQLAALARSHPVDTPIGSGDLLHIDVFDVPELSRDVRVSDTGDISFPLIPDRIPAAGVTPFELESRLEKLLIENGLVSHPNVSVFVKEQNSAPVSVVGAVNHAMVYQVSRPTTLLEVLSAAGGVSDTAGDTIIVTRRARASSAPADAASAANDPPADDQKITIRLRDLLESGDSVYNIPIFGGDTITVPPAGIVYVLGFGVAQPGGYVVESHGERITVLKALALAHGVTTFAKLDSATIMRTNPATGQKDSIPVRIKEIQDHKADDVPLLSNDILYVPDSRGKKALARGTEAALGIGTGVAIYRIP
ncbi:MAG TPA: polysaccharide biosynthesis/export family protein [Verrucomicrobiae bacterium]|nr:polysaccharide biosynthesis/export family protein [Verrucomicrobiae bacterium]